MKLVMGFRSYPYVGRSRATSPLPVSKRAKRVSRAQRSYGEGKNTAQVAAELEKRYGIVETFYDMEQAAITEIVEEKFADDIDDVLMMQKPSRKGISNRATNKIESMFRRALDNKRFDGVISGVPTTASLRGVSHQFRRPYAKRAPRPSFVDTGMYRQSFHVWVEED